ncbi:MAG: DUF5652 family protein [Patescibacteria group bacterium]
MMNYWNGYGWQSMPHWGWWAWPVGGFLAGLGGLLFGLILIWSLYWKGMAMWKAAHHKHKWWFVALLITNTAGILDLLYIHYFSKKPWAK